MLKITSFSEKNLYTYSVNDYILPLVIPNSYDKVFLENFICNQWPISSKVKRIDGDKVMCLQSNDLQNVKDSLINSPIRVLKQILDQLNNTSSTLFSNKRKVALSEV